MNLLGVAIVAGILIGVSLGAVGGGGSILAVPVLAFALGQTPVQATTGSLAVVGSTALIGAVTAWRHRAAAVDQGLLFGTVAIAGAVVGALGSQRVPERYLIVSFGALMVVVGSLMVVRLWRHKSAREETLEVPPIITLNPFTCACPRAAKVAVTATAVGLLTGFLGVGGGFLVVPALVLALDVPMKKAAGTSLVVIAITSVSALAVRSLHGSSLQQPDWALVAMVTVSAVAGTVVGQHLAKLASERVLTASFTTLVLGVAGYTLWRAVPPLMS